MQERGAFRPTADVLGTTFRRETICWTTVPMHEQLGTVLRRVRSRRLAPHMAAMPAVGGTVAFRAEPR